MVKVMRASYRIVPCLNSSLLENGPDLGAALPIFRGRYWQDPGQRCVGNLFLRFSVSALSYNLKEFRYFPVASDPGPLLLTAPRAPVAPSVLRRRGSHVVKTCLMVSGFPGCLASIPVQTNT